MSSRSMSAFTSAGVLDVLLAVILAVVLVVLVVVVVAGRSAGGAGSGMGAASSTGTRPVACAQGAQGAAAGSWSLRKSGKLTREPGSQ